MENISVIIPAFNEEMNIANAIRIAKKSSRVNDVIVIDNLSTDKTAEIAKENGARVEYCPNKGKGNAMHDGIGFAKNDIIVFLDADVKYDNEDVVDCLANPIINGQADFVKSTFDRITGGVVTEVAVKPLLNLLFPDMYKFSEPISGMIASKKNILEKLEFEKDYGVDIGILIDVISSNYNVCEVNIGKIENMSHRCKNNTTMAKMSTEISRVILKKAKYLK